MDIGPRPKGASPDKAHRATALMVRTDHFANSARTSWRKSRIITQTLTGTAIHRGSNAGQGGMRPHSIMTFKANVAGTRRPTSRAQSSTDIRPRGRRKQYPAELM